MYRRVAPGRPTRAASHETGVIQLPDHDLPRRGLDLRMAFQAKVVVPFHEQLLVDRAVWIVASRAAFAQRLMLEREGPRLLAMALRARLIQLRHRQPARRLSDVAPVRVMAIHTVHAVFHDRMVVRQFEFGVNFEVTLIAACGVLARIDDELAPAPSGRDVFAARTVAGFAAREARPFQIVFVEAPVRTGGEDPRNVRVAIRARLVAHESRAFDFRRGNDRSGQRGTRTQNQARECQDGHGNGGAQPPALLN